MDSLLRWGIEHSTTDGSHPPPQPRTDLDPGIIDLILGKPDSVLMREALEVAVDNDRDEEERVTALDNLEMLVENIDNANDLGKLNMWQPLHNMLVSPSSSDTIKTQTLWVIGTAVQNNPSAQSAYLSITPLSTLIGFLSPSEASQQTRSKAVYALSGLLKHNADAVETLGAIGGWNALTTALEDSDITVRRKTIFLINTLLTPTSLEPHQPRDTGEIGLHTPQTGPVHANSHARMASDPSSTETATATMKALHEHGLLTAIVSALIAPTPHGPDGESEGDHDFEEKIVRTLHTYAMTCHGQFSVEQKQQLGRFFEQQSQKANGDAVLAERWGLSVDELKALRLAATWTTLRPLSTSSDHAIGHGER